MAFGVLAGQITVIFLEVLLGYVGARSGIIKDRDSKFLSDFIMKLLLPCTMLAGAAVDGEPELLTQAGVLFLLWARQDLNPRPSGYEPPALTN